MPKIRALTNIPSPSTSSHATDSPEPEDDKMTTLYEGVEINYESTILVSDLRRCNGTPWGLDYLEQHNFSTLFSISDIVYPRLVRQFYQNMRNPDPYNTEFTTLETTIDGMRIEFTAAQIAIVLGMDLYRQPYSGQSEGRLYSTEEIITEMCKCVTNKNNVIRRAHLPKKLWIIDHVFRRTLFPLGREKERSGRFLQALMAVYKKEWFSPGISILLDMWEVHMTIEDQKYHGARKLHFPRIITRILMAYGFPFCATEPMIQEFPIFGSGEWNRSLCQLNTQRRITQESSVDQLPMRQQVIFSTAQFDQLTRIQLSILQKQDQMIQWQREMATAHCALDRQVFNIDAIIRSLVDHQNTIIAQRIFNDMINTGLRYVAPRFTEEASTSSQANTNPIANPATTTNPIPVDDHNGNDEDDYLANFANED